MPAAALGAPPRGRLWPTEYEGESRRRPLTYDEVQALFDAADARPAQIRGHGRKGTLTALRDAAVSVCTTELASWKTT
ncbi:hypothetical protein S1361_37685 [Streptomyces cyanogenus]|uniref:Uncharacterized protein n=1 Tax=Streptomyces cyanogenus TaxID=80860 RepID=A0ABX7U583_STRCY|nr:hypothetical protein S1361_37685 [Streptomyces cyanogenus]